MADNLPEPESRKEQYLAKAAGMTVEDLPTPASREELYLNAIAEGGGGGGTSYTAGDGINISNNEISVDTDTIQPKLTAGTNITIDANNVISAEGGGGATVVQDIGTSTTDVMSQKAVTDELFYNHSKGKVQIGASADSSSPGNNSSIAIGNSSKSKNDSTIAIGTRASSLAGNGICLGTDSSGGTSSFNSVAIGRESSVTAAAAVAVGTHATATQQGQFDISTGDVNWGYNNSAYRLLTGLYDPQSAHDAATKGYVDGLVGNVEAALNVINNGGSN